MNVILTPDNITSLSYLEAKVGSINGHRDGSNCCHGYLEVILALALDIPVAGHGGTDVGRTESALLILQNSPRFTTISKFTDQYY